MYGLFIDRIRIDLGQETFVDGDCPGEPIVTELTLPALLKEIKRYIESKKGELVEINPEDGSFIMDTPDLTLECRIDVCDAELSKEDIKLLINSMEASIK